MTALGAHVRDAPGFAVGVVHDDAALSLHPHARRPSRSDCRSCSTAAYGRGPRNLHYGEVGLDGGQLVTSGYLRLDHGGDGCGRDHPGSAAAAYRLADRVVVPNVRYRRDIGDKLDRRPARCARKARML